MLLHACTYMYVHALHDLINTCMQFTLVCQLTSKASLFDDWQKQFATCMIDYNSLTIEETVAKGQDQITASVLDK